MWLTGWMDPVNEADRAISRAIGPGEPGGMVPAFRLVLDSGLLDMSWVRADVRSRLLQG